MDNPATIDYVFGMFDVNGDGFVLVEEVQQRFKMLYRCCFIYVLKCR